MPAPHQIKPNHKSLKDYYDALRAYADQNVSHESAVRSAFQNLLAEVGRRFGWTLIPQRSAATRGMGVPARDSARIRPDAAFRDAHRIERGHWEAKNCHDDPDANTTMTIVAGPHAHASI